MNPDILSDYVDRVYGYAVSRTYSREEADELAQEILYTAVNSLQNLRDEDRFEPWLCQYVIIRTNGKILDYQGVLAFVGAHSIPFPALKSSTNYDEKGGR